MSMSFNNLFPVNELALIGENKASTFALKKE